jgi:hypothetical protein
MTRIFRGILLVAFAVIMFSATSEACHRRRSYCQPQPTCQGGYSNGGYYDASGGYGMTGGGYYGGGYTGGGYVGGGYGYDYGRPGYNPGGLGGPRSGLGVRPGMGLGGFGPGR